MADKEIKVGFPEVKVEALEFFLREKDEQIEPMIKEHLDKMYEKYVPPQVRKFVEAKAGIVNEETPQQTEVVQQAPRQQSRRGSRANVPREDNSSQTESTSEQTETLEQQPTDVEETAGMTMGM